MSKTLSIQYFNFDTENYKATEKYLNSLGMTFYNGFKDSYFQIEVVQEPSILDNLRESGIYDLNRKLYIIRVTDKGITLYFVWDVGDNYVFIPSNQIITIHTVDKTFINKIEDRIIKNKLDIS